MREETGDLWEYHANGWWVVIPTNKQIRRNGSAVMGAGLALEAAKRFPGIEYEYGWRLKQDNYCYLPAQEKRLILLPTKEHWKNPSSLTLIESGCLELRKRLLWVKERCWVESPGGRVTGSFKGIALPRLGCGLGGLRWEAVCPIMGRILTDDCFVVVAE